MENRFEQMASNSQSEHQLKQFKSKQQLKKEVNKKMTTKTIYLPTVYVDEATGEIIEKEQLKNLSYKSNLITKIEENGTTKKIQDRKSVV